MKDEDAQLEELCELSNASAEALQSPWEPLVVALAFSTPGRHERHLTMQQWIDLHAIRSPYLHGERPDERGFFAAAEILQLNVGSGTSAEDRAHLQNVILGACTRAFYTVQKMRAEKAQAGSYEEDGFGTWLPLYACLVAELGLTPETALALRVDRAFALIAGLRHNQGQRAVGVPYGLRELTTESEGAS
jgi:hypothetical protein